MKKSLLAIPAFMAALSLAPVFSTNVSAQDAEKKEDAKAEGTKAEAKKESYTLLQKWAAGDVFTRFDEVGFNMAVSMSLPDGSKNDQPGASVAAHAITQFEILETAEDGSVTKLRLYWHDGKTTQTQEDPVTGDTTEVEEDFSYAGLKIVYTWDADLEEWTGEHEEGGVDLSDAEINKIAQEQDLPITDHRLPSEAVSVGDEWELDEDIIEKIFKNMVPEQMSQMAEGLNPKNKKGSCKVKELLESEEEGYKYLLITYEITMDVDSQQQGANVTGAISAKGEFYWDVLTSRVAGSEDDVVVEANAEAQGASYSVKMEMSNVTSLYEGKAETLFPEEDEAEGDSEKKDSEDSEDGASEEGAEDAGSDE